MLTTFVLGVLGLGAQFLIIEYAVLGALQAYTLRLEKPTNGTDRRVRQALHGVLARHSDETR